MEKTDLPSVRGNIFLVGLMGAGKTTLGRELSRQLGKTFYDADREIEHRTGVKIPVIFEIEGEAGFRAREAAVIQDLAQKQDIVLATGGGAVLLPENRALLRAHGTVVYLCAPLDELFARTHRDRNRPLLATADPRARLGELLAQRDGLYREVADLVLDTRGHNVPALARELAQKLARR